MLKRQIDRICGIGHRVLYGAIAAVYAGAALHIVDKPDAGVALCGLYFLLAIQR